METTRAYIQTMVEIFLFGLGRTKYVVHRRDSANRVVNLTWTRKKIEFLQQAGGEDPFIIKLFTISAIIKK